MIDEPKLAEQAEEPKPAEPYEWEKDFWLKQPPFSKEFGQAVFERFARHANQWDTNTPVGESVWAAYRVYHNLSNRPANLTLSLPMVGLMEAGEAGEFMSLQINHFRALVRQKVALITSDRVVWDPQAATSGSDSAKQVTLTRNILDYAMRAKLFEQRFADQMEMSEVTGAGFMACGWDANVGASGKGDIWCEVLAPWEVCHERVRTYDSCTWWIFRRMESRWPWVAKLAKSDPEKARKVADHQPERFMISGVRTSDAEVDSDQIPVLYVYAAANEACPQGRLAALISEDCVLLDSELPFGPVPPITRVSAAEFMGTSIPYANSWAVLPIQEALTVATSAIMTRLDIGAVPDVTAPDGVELEQGMLGGANIVKYPPGMDKPEILDLLAIPSSLGKIKEDLIQDAERLTGINGVVRGAPPDNVTSGSMAALIQAQAVQFNSAEQRAYTLNLETVGTHLIKIYQAMATEEQIISIAGQDEMWTAAKFKKDDINLITRVAVRTTSAFMKTLSGRKEIADQLLNAKLIEDPRQYLKAIETGDLSPLFKSATDVLNIVKEENERMIRGEQVLVVSYDHHAIHVREHVCELNTEARYDEARRLAITKHIDEHMQIWAQLSREDPDALEAIGCPPLSNSFGVGQQANAMGPGGAPIKQPSQVPPLKMPGAAETKASPGPEPAPRGQEPSQAAPSVPRPAKAANQGQPA